MAYPILAPNSTWWAPTVSTVTRASITEIEIMDSYTPDSSITVVDSWDASAVKDGSITCYVIGTKLIIAGNGSGMIALNEESRDVFGGYSEDISFPYATTFAGCTFLDVSKCINIWRAFGFMRRLKTLDLSGWNLEKATSFSQMFYCCTALQNINLSRWTFSNILDAPWMFYGCESLQNINFSGWNTRSVSNMHSCFEGCLSLETLDLSEWDVSNTTLMDFAFSGCSKLKTLGDISGWNLSSCTTTKAMFQSCSSLKGIDTSNWDMSNVTDMAFMFYGCSSLGEIDVSNWDTSKLTNIDHFAAHAGLHRIGMEKWNTSSLINANAAFHNCAEEELDLSGWDVSKVQFFCQMFENSPNLKRIKGLEKWNTSAGLGFDGMFERCYKLEEVDLSSFDTSKAKNGVEASNNDHKTATLQNMFLSCNNLKKITLGSNFAVNGDGTNTAAANKLILPTPSTDYIEGADGSWYTFNGDSYAPNAIPDRTYNTYYASEDLIRDLNVRVNNGTILDIVEAVREKVPDLGPTLLSDLDDIIKNI